MSDLGTVFTSDLMKKLCQILQIKLKYAIVKHPQTVGIVEGSHSAVKKYPGICEDWHFYVDPVVFVQHYISCLDRMHSDINFSYA